jgi:hypothetical protein
MASPSLPRVPRVVPLARRYYETLRLLAARFAALRFLRLAIPCVVSLVRPQQPRTWLRINLEFLARFSSRHLRWRRQGLPSSRKTQLIIRHVLRPRRDQARGWVQVSLMPGTAPASDNGEGSPRRLISGLNCTAFDLAVYASQGQSPTHRARLASGCWPGSTGRDWLPAGFQ